MRRHTFIVLLLLFAFMLSGFGEKHKKPCDGPSAEVAVNRPVYSPGEKVKMSVKLTNPGKDVMATYFPSGKKFDFIVMDNKKKEVWRWSKGKMFIMAIQPFRLEPGKSIAYSYVWDQKDDSGVSVRPGRYYITGEISIAERIRSQEKAITIK